MKYFECKAGELCEKADCCSSRATMPALSFGDFYRLSQFTGESMAEIWKSKGAITLVPDQGKPSGNFITMPGLLHDPCPYLAEDYKCSVHEARPMGCATFPLAMFINHPESITGENFCSYKCLQGVQNEPSQLEIYSDIEDIFQKEARTDLSLWRNRMIDLSNVDNDYLEAFNRALIIQQLKGGQDRTTRLFKSMENMLQAQERGSLNITDYAFFLSPVMTCILDEAVLEVLENLKGEQLKAYQETTKQWQKLAKKLK